MATIKERKDKYCVIYHYKDNDGKRRQKWETFDTKLEAKRRKKEIEYQEEMGTFKVAKCKVLHELLDEYVLLYGKVLSDFIKNTGRYQSGIWETAQ